MTTIPLHDVVIVGVHNTKQARRLEGESSLSLTIEAARGAMADAGVEPADIDLVISQSAQDLIREFRLGPCQRQFGQLGIATIAHAAAMIASGLATTALLATGGAAMYTERAATAPWTRPANEYVVSYGLFTAAEFALVARRHMIQHGTTAEQMATVAATIRNNGHVNPDAVYSGRGPFTVEDILASRMVAEPFHLLECSTTSEGGCSLVLTTRDRAADLPGDPVFILGMGSDSFGPSYQMAPAWDLRGNRGIDVPNGYVGRHAAQNAMGMAQISPSDVDTCEFYDPFAFEIIRQFEAYGFCGEGEGGDFVMDGRIEVGGACPVTTDGGTMSYSHAGINAQQFQRVIRGVQQIRGECVSRQVPGAEIALCSNGGAGALFTDVMVLGKDRP